MLGLGGGVYFYSSPPAAENKPAVSTGQIKSLADLGGKRVAFITGTTGDFVIRDKYKTSQVVDMVYPADAALALRTNKVDAFVFDKNTLQYIIAKNPNEFELLAEHLGVRLEISDMSYDAMIAALQVGKIDLAIANFYKVEERQKACEFSTPYIRNDISAMVRRQKP